MASHFNPFYTSKIGNAMVSDRMEYSTLPTDAEITFSKLTQMESKCLDNLVSAYKKLVGSCGS